jgi:hypothetical protein
MENGQGIMEMRSSITANHSDPADIIALGKSRHQSGQADSGTARQSRPGSNLLTLPEDVVTLSSHQTDPDTPPVPVRTMRSLPVTPTEKKALLGSKTPSSRLSIYG